MGFDIKTYLDLEITEKLIKRAIKHGACQTGIDTAHRLIGSSISALPKGYADWCARLVDGPSQLSDGTIEWYLNGKRHRVDGPAVEDGYYKAWYLDGKLHRVDGPAIEHGDYKVWYLNGKLHRADGPAVEDGSLKEWYFNGKRHYAHQLRHQTAK